MTKRISELNSTALPNRLHEVWAERNLVDVKLRIEQILGLITNADLAGKMAAPAVSFSPGAGPLTATDVAAAIEELAASATDVAAALAEIAADYLRHNTTQSLSIAQKINVLNNVGIPRKGNLFGLTLSNAAGDAEHDITIAAGQVSSSNIDPVIIDLSSAITKRLDATFVEGTGNGGMVSGESLPTSGTVHAWLGMKADGTVDAFFNDHASSGLAPTNPAGFLWRRRIGSLRTDASANIRGFIQTGDWFIYKIPVADVSGAAQGATPTNRAISVPTGFKLLARVNIYTTSTTQSQVVIVDPDISSKTAGTGPVEITDLVNSSIASRSDVLEIMTNSSSQVSTSMNGSSNTVSLTTTGWMDTRGRLN